MNISLDQWRAVIGLFNAFRLKDFRSIFNLNQIFLVLMLLAFSDYIQVNKGVQGMLYQTAFVSLCKH